VALRFGVGDLAATAVDRPRLAPHDAEPPAGRARLLGPEERGLPLQEIHDRPPGHGAGRDGGHLLDVVGVEVQFRPDILVDPGRATILSHPSAIRSTPVRSIDGDLRNGIGDPSLDFG
jgi:hypothetical protein